jgi:hypothetical protein
MANDTNILVLEHLRAIRAKLDNFDVRVDEVVRTQAGMLQLLSAQDSRLLRIESDISIIKQRLELVEA